MLLYLHRQIKLTFVGLHSPKISNYSKEKQTIIFISVVAKSKANVYLAMVLYLWKAVILMIQTKRTYMEEDKQQVHLPDINRTHKVSKFVIKRKNKVKLDPEIVKSKLRAIDLRKSAKATNIDWSKSTISVKESAISSEQR